MEVKHSFAVRWFHWVNFPVIALMVWSGLWIYWANDVYRVGFGDRTLFHFFPDSFYAFFRLDHKLAQGMAWHFCLMWPFAANGLGYVGYLLLSGEWRVFLRKFNPIQGPAYVAVILMGGASLLTGLAIYKPTELSSLTRLCGGYEAARFEHFWLTAGFCAFFVVHVAQVARAGWANFRSMVTGRGEADG